MNIKLKLTALLMVVMLVVSMVGCGSAPAGSDSTPSSSSIPESSTPKEPVVPEREYVKGVTADGEYVSEFWGIKFTSPSEDTMLATPEQIAELLGIGSEAMGTDPEMLEAMKQQMDSYELVAVDMATGTTLMIICAELPMSGISPDIYIKGIIEGAKSSGSNVTVELENDGAAFKETLVGKEFTCTSYTLVGEGVPPNHQTQRLFIDGKRALIVSSTYPPELEAATAMEKTMLAALTATGDKV